MCDSSSVEITDVHELAVCFVRKRHKLHTLENASRGQKGVAAILSTHLFEGQVANSAKIVRLPLWAQASKHCKGAFKDLDRDVQQSYNYAIAESLTILSQSRVRKVLCKKDFGEGWQMSFHRFRVQLGRFYGASKLMKIVLFAFIPLLACSLLAFSAPKDNAPCKAFFMAIEQDDSTVSLKMAGLNKLQYDWYRKAGNKKEFAGVCLAPANASGQQVPVEVISDEYMNGIGDAPFYLLAWEQHQVFVPDNNGGHYAFSSNGTLSRWEKSKPKGKNFVVIGPVHNTNRTILSSSSISLLKELIRQIRQKEGL